MSIFRMPMTNIPQIFQISLAGKDYLLTSKWNDSDDAGWELDIADALTGLPIVAGLPVITGADILGGLGYLGIGGKLICYTDGDETAVPSLNNFGVESNLYFITED